MDFHLNNHNNNSSPSSSNSSSTPNPLRATPSASIATTATTTAGDDPMHSWWESISKARSRIHALASILPSSSSDSLMTLADSDRPALSLLSSPTAYSAVSDSLSSPESGAGSDPLCNWLYDTFLSSDPHLRLVVLSYLPLLSGLYLTRIHNSSSDSTTSLPSLSGFEAVLLALYASETKSRGGKPVVVTIPDLSQPSIYHTPRKQPGGGGSGNGVSQTRPSVGVMSAPLEPMVAVKSTKRACIVGVALDCYYKQISQMPSWSKLEFCQFAAGWAGQDCPCRREFDSGEEEVNTNGFPNGVNSKDEVEVEIEEEVVEEMGNLAIQRYDTNASALDSSKGARIPLPWELLQPVLRILGHCLLAPLNSQEVKDAASVAVRCLYARASHDLVPQAILATRSLIQLDKRARDTAKAAAATANSSSNANTPSKAKKPEILLVSK
ncbi:putative hyccin [Senna tora]|uniref:Putative hyccin n=1 Tax=Senna tora TaxID=362788 RepID=A0A835CGW1_9FABA|nr:putative hyccin [Senna tora]